MERNAKDIYSDIMNKAWKFFRKHYSNPPKSIDDWPGLMMEMTEILYEWINTDFERFANGLFWKMTEEIEALFLEDKEGATI